MAFSKHHGSEIVGMVTVLPATVEDNLSLELLSKEEREALVNHTGIRFRRIASQDTTIRDLFETAISRLLKKLDWDLDQIDVLICVTQTPTMVIPSVANRLHGDLKLSSNTMCFDMISGCSGFVYGLNSVYSILSGLGNTARAILCCGDISTQLIDKNDKSVRPIFSDAATAIAVEYNKDNKSLISYFNLQSEGSGQHAIEIPSGNCQTMQLNGIDVFGYSVKLVPQNIQQLLDFSSHSIVYPDLFAFHQANKLINESIKRKLEIPDEKVPYSISEFGNTASASIPLTLSLVWDDCKKHSNQIVVAGFGVGFSVASALLPFQPKFCDIVQDY
ncbi:MAG: ketoacyl-ACP synthase III [Crocinitomicaceae bacterium]|nr:ketoacyl-ACP synthase III [Crocinitomicaceae bacterium]